MGVQAFQKGLIKGIVSVTNLASKLVEAKKYKGQFIPVADAAYYLAIDALTLSGNSAFEFSMKRREMLKSEVAPGSKSLCRDSQPITSMLCGDKLTQSIRVIWGRVASERKRVIWGRVASEHKRVIWGRVAPEHKRVIWGRVAPEHNGVIWGRVALEHNSYLGTSRPRA